MTLEALIFQGYSVVTAILCARRKWTEMDQNGLFLPFNWHLSGNGFSPPLRAFFPAWNPFLSAVPPCFTVLLWLGHKTSFLWCSTETGRMGHSQGQSPPKLLHNEEAAGVRLNRARTRAGFDFHQSRKQFVLAGPPASSPAFGLRSGWGGMDSPLWVHCWFTGTRLLFMVFQ